MKPSLTVLETTLSPEEIATALRLTSDQVLQKFRDPRVTSWFAELWGEKLFRYTAHGNANHPGSDAQITLGDIGRFEIAVRCFYKGNIRFQKSRDIGSGRSATTEDLIEAIEGIEIYLVVDLRTFPTLRFFPMDTKALLRLIRQGKLGINGLTPRRFDTWITDEFAITTRTIEL